MRRCASAGALPCSHQCHTTVAQTQTRPRALTKTALGLLWSVSSGCLSVSPPLLSPALPPPPCLSLPVFRIVLSVSAMIKLVSVRLLVDHPFCSFSAIGYDQQVPALLEWCLYCMMVAGGHFFFGSCSLIYSRLDFYLSSRAGF